MTRILLAAAGAAALLVLPAAAAPSFALTIFVSNEKDNTVTVIDGETLEIKKTIKTSRRPRGIMLSPDYKELFVAAGDGDIMDVIDTGTLEVTRQLESGPDPELMAVDSKGKVIYIANEDDSLVTIMDIKSGEVLGEVPVGVEPEGMTVSADDRYTVATSESTSMAHIIDNATMKLVGNILVDSRPREAKFSPDGKELWVSSEIGGTISVIDTTNWDDPKSWKVVKEIGFEVPGVRPEQLQPVGMDFTKDGKLLFVPLGPSNRVGGRRHSQQGGQDLHSRGSAALAWRVRPRWHEILRRQRAHQRHDHHRRGDAGGREVRAGRPAALGSCCYSVTLSEGCIAGRKSMRVTTFKHLEHSRRAPVAYKEALVVSNNRVTPRQVS